MITNKLPYWLKDAEELSNNRAKWDWLKFKIKTSLIALSKKVSKDRQKREEEVNAKYQDALNLFQQNLFDATRLETKK